MSFRFSLCSEVYKCPVDEVIPRVARLGFDGIEIAPFMVAENVDDVPPARRREIADIARSEGIEIVGLHWLLLSPEGLHLTTPNDGVRRRTVKYLESLVRFCADLGGKVLVLGSPKQRNLAPGDDPAGAKQRAAEGLRSVGDVCEERGARLLLEALNPAETNFMTTVEDALEVVALTAHPSIGYMLDCKAMSGMPGGIVENIARYGKDAGHIHANEPGGLGPGMGTMDFRPVLSALRESGYSGWISTEPFDYRPDPDTVGRTALETLRRAAS